MEKKLAILTSGGDAPGVSIKVKIGSLNLSAIS